MMVSKFISIPLAAMLAASPALAENDKGVSGKASVGAEKALGTGAVRDATGTNVTGSGKVKANTNTTKTNQGLHRCGGNRGQGMGNYCALNFGGIDVNANGELTLSEFQSDGLSVSLFQSLDTDGNGILSRTEFDAYGPKR